MRHFGHANGIRGHEPTRRLLRRERRSGLPVRRHRRFRFVPARGPTSSAVPGPPRSAARGAGPWPMA
ncbi:hypothetical protein [Ornithinimicrobium kibberense]|uniref:hypothetical protein n=1 Tax=Ornithinimicrobium kibberense TaxID=282060 RepID=UPI00360DD28F